MPTIDWRRLTEEAGLVLTGDAIDVHFHDGRRQQVLVEDTSPMLLRVWSVAARPAMLRRLDDPDVYAWRRNRQSDLVGFKIDARGRLIGEAWVPTDGLDAGEWDLYVRTVARACDRVEYLLSGRDEA